VAMLDEVLEAWRNRLLGDAIYLYLDARSPKGHASRQKGADECPNLRYGGPNCHRVGESWKKEDYTDLRPIERSRSALADLSQRHGDSGHAGCAVGDQRRSCQAGKCTSGPAGMCAFAALHISPAADCGPVFSSQIDA
jgi:hypothetical protein